MTALTDILNRYRQILVFDTETTGLDPARDEIIQFCGYVICLHDDGPAVGEIYNEYIRLSPGRTVPPEITQLTGITDSTLRARGISKAKFCRDLKSLIPSETLLAAYNAQFDLSFLFYTLANWGNPGILQGQDKLDLLTVYRDRRPYPHRLSCALESYGLNDDRNSHRAEEDTLGTYHLMQKMAEEKDDLLNYVNLFGYMPRYGKPRKQIRSVTYLPQGYEPTVPLYTHLPEPPVLPPIRHRITCWEFAAMFAADEENAAREDKLRPLWGLGGIPNDQQ